MQLTPTAEQQAIKDAVRQYAADQITLERLAGWRRLPRGIDTEAWQQIGALGWFGLGLPVEMGGSGMGLVEVACLLEECGRAAVPASVIAAIRAAVALAWLDPRYPGLAKVARGQMSVALALDERHARSPAHFMTRLEQRGEHSTVSGEKWCVSGAVDAALHIVAAQAPQGLFVVLVDASGADQDALGSFDSEPQACVTYRNAPVLRSLGEPPAGEQLLAELRRRQTALALAEMTGGMDAVLLRTVAYVKEREQFGQKLAVFQAVQHQIADMATAYTAARHLAWQAITRLAAGSEQGNELASAAAFAGQAYKRLTLTAHHLHGGAGYVVEHPLHDYTERAQALCIRDTPEAAALAEVAANLLDD